MLGPVQTKWVEALRSGEYKQTKGSLRIGNQYCCLGVACEVLGVPFEDGKYGCGNACLDQAQVETLGLRDELGGFEGNSLANMNDSGFSFEVLAGFIEENADKVFVEVK